MPLINMDDNTRSFFTFYISIQMVLPMLIRNLTDIDYKHGVYVEPKYDGIRAIVMIDPETNKMSIYSRTGKRFTGFKCIEYEAYKLLENGKRSNIVLDGELYKHGMHLQDISGIVRTIGSINSDDVSIRPKEQLKLYIFDLYDKQRPNLQQWQRKELLDELFKRYDANVNANRSTSASASASAPTSCITKVHTTIVHSKDQLEQLYDKYLKEGYEGAIIRKKESVYEPGTRSKQVFKLKPYHTSEFTIVDSKEGIGKDKGAIILILASEGMDVNNASTFAAVPNVAYTERVKMWNDRYDLLGKQATVQYVGLSKDGIPLQPKVIAIRDYE